MITQMNFTKINFDEEKILLDAIKRNVFKFLGNGSARLVFSTRLNKNKSLNSNEENIFSKIGILNKRNNYIIKVGIFPGGINQNQTETNVFVNCNDLPCFARIVAAGKFILIMERVKLLARKELYTLFNLIDDVYNVKPYLKKVEKWNKRHTLPITEAAQQLNITLRTMDNVLGKVYDGFQLGISKLTNNIVIYDYGVDGYPHYDSDDNVSPDEVEKASKDKKYLTDIINDIESNLTQYIYDDNKKLNYYLYELSESKWEDD